MKRNLSLRSALKVALRVGVSAAAVAALPLQISYAASNDGSLVGRITASDQSSLDGISITVRNPETGFTRTVKAESDGSYRFPFLPVGKYIVEGTRNGATLGKLAEVTVGLGTATTADVTVNISNLEEVFVVGTRVVRAVDVRSTESATNLTREDLERLPVDRDIQSVALLAPGLSKGDAGLCSGGNCGVSFGGSSIAENTIYINGLNVTDFYNRVGSSSVPYAFYKEFQVKTGGYSVEFGRTTGGVINAVTRSGTNEFEYGTEVAWKPHSLQSSKKDRYNPDGTQRIIGSYDQYDSTSATFYASGPIVKDKLFFFALYEARDYQPENTNDAGGTLYKAKEDSGFWGAKIDWQINDKNLLELLAFSDENEEVRNAYSFDFVSGGQGPYQQTRYTNNGGLNWSATYTAYLTDNFSAKALYGENNREFSRFSQNDLECNRVRNQRVTPARDLGCTESGSVTARDDTREAARLDFEWVLGAHQLRFGLDHETNTSQYEQYYPGPDRLLYEIYRTNAPTTIEGVALPSGTEYVRTRQNEVDGEFETLNSAYYLEDNWQVTPSLLLNAGLRVEAFDNKNSDGDSYIKMDNMVAPRFGFSWDVKGDSRSKLFGNAGRYFLPVANVINIKQAGGFLDRRVYYYFGGLESFDYNGATKQRPILGAQFAVDDSQGDGTVGDLRGEVDADMDPVYQDELILGFQSMIDDKWSWGVRGIYRKLNNAIDDMEITSTGIICGGEPVEAGYVMANPGRPVTIYSDTNCDGESDGWVTIDTSRAGWAMYDDDGNYVGEVGYSKPKRNYKAIEFMIDRAWDDQWSFNAVYTLSYSKGNAEGPINSDTDFGDTGRTEAFDNPWVNYGSYGYLPNDHRHQLKVRGSYALGEHWEVGGTLTAQSGRPINATGECNPYDDTCFFSFYVFNDDTGQFEQRPRGSAGRTPWIFDLGANVTYRHAFSAANLKVTLAVYNLLNQQRVMEVDEELGSTGVDRNQFYGFGTGYQAPRYAFLTLKLDF
ncbi:TonB-dependent receptor [Steroidobacter cummioxidans]|uniref:TonB-dependent receptor n=1 Tax=Steroidobacter cummioxidans TaxID=1803913 RepID=UPI000E318B9F|nr:TonB-dependent receptor [Steroidobacter cummioxidans]